MHYRKRVFFTSVFFTLFLTLFTFPVYAEWQTNFVTSGSSYVGLSDGNVFFKRYVSGQWVDIQATWMNDWHEQAVEGEFPEYPSSYGPDVKTTLHHNLIKAGDQLYATVIGTYSTSFLNSEGILNALFINSLDGSDWIRISAVEIVSFPDVAVDRNGIIWFAWQNGNNRTPGNIMLSSYNPTTGTITTPEIVDDSCMRLSFGSIRIVPKGNKIWMVYRGVDGVYAKMRRSNGAWKARKQILASIWPPDIDAVWARNTLWIVTNEMNISLYKLENGSFVLDKAAIFPGRNVEIDGYIEDLTYAYPVFMKPSEHDIVIAAASYYYFENEDEEIDERKTVISQRLFNGAFSAPETVSQYYCNVPGKFIPGIIAGSNGNVFVTQEVSDLPIEKQQFVMGWTNGNISITLEELVKNYPYEALEILNIWKTEITEGYADDLQIKRTAWLKNNLIEGK